MGGWGIQSAIGGLFDRMSNYFSPKSAPSSGVLACQARPAPTPAKPTAALVFKAVPCDVAQLTVTVPGEGGDVSFTAAQSLVRQMTPAAAPERLKGYFADYDLVLETIGPEAGRATSNASVAGWNENYGRNDLGGPSRASGQDGAKLSVSASWAASCSEAGHRALQYVPDHVAQATDGQQAALAGAKLNKFFYSRPLPGLSDIRGLMSALLDSHQLVADYMVVAASCGRPAAGAARGSLSALVKAYPKGVIGFKFALAPPGGKGDWSAALEARDKAALAAEQARLEAASKRPGSLRKGSGRAARAAHQAATRSANRNRADLRALKSDVANNIVTRKESGRNKVGWSVNDGCSLEISAIYADREISFEDAKALWETLKRIQAASDSLTSFISFVQDFTPSLVQPKVGVSFKVLNGDIQIGAAHYPVAKGARFQAVEHEYFVSVDIVVLGAEGSAGLVVGKMVLGTGMDVTALVTVAGQVGVKGEATFFEGATPAAEAKGEVKVGVSGDFRASVAYREIISASVEANIGVKVSSEFDFKKVKFGEVKWVLPAVVFVGNYRNAITGAAETRRIELSREKEGRVYVD